MFLSRKAPPCYSPAPSGDLVEIVDTHGSPVCLMAVPDAVSQRLAYRSAAVLVHDDWGRFLLREVSPRMFDVTVCAPLAAGQAMAEFAENLLERALGQKTVLKFLFSRPETQAGAMTVIFGAKFSSSMLAALAPPGYMLADREDLRFLDDNKWLEPLASGAASFYL